MEAFASLLNGLAIATQPMNMLYALIGVLLGTAVGVLPGIGPALTVALLLPITFKLDPAGSLIMFAGIYYGGMYGGSTTSILINTPGESASMVTALEGNKMAKEELLEILKVGKSWTGELEHRAKDGRQIFVESRHQAIDNDGDMLILDGVCPSRRTLRSVKQRVEPVQIQVRQ